MNINYRKAFSYYEVEKPNKNIGATVKIQGSGVWFHFFSNKKSAEIVSQDFLAGITTVLRLSVFILLTTLNQK